MKKNKKHDRKQAIRDWFESLCTIHDDGHFKCVRISLMDYTAVRRVAKQAFKQTFPIGYSKRLRIWRWTVAEWNSSILAKECHQRPIFEGFTHLGYVVLDRREKPIARYMLASDGTQEQCFESACRLRDQLNLREDFC
jgi:hypothetical protein